MSRPRLRAVVLAAGLGTRLRPLTTNLPKPLLPILGRPLVAWTLERLAEAGVEATAINLHHCADAIPAALGGDVRGMPLHYSREDPILGTLGALHPLREFLAPADLVLLVNGDSLCRWPFDELIARHRETSALATLLLSSTAPPDAFGGGVAVDPSGRVLTLLPGGSYPGTVRRVFIGAHAFSPSVALEAPAAFSDIVRDLYEPRLRAGARIESVTTATPWHDLGTPARYLEAVLDWAPATWVEPTAAIDPSAALEHVVVEAGAVVEAGVSARSTLMLDGSRIGRSSRLERVVVGPGVVIPAGSALDDVLVTAHGTTSLTRTVSTGRS